MILQISADEACEAIALYISTKFPDLEPVKPEEIRPVIQDIENDYPEFTGFTVPMPQPKKK